MTEYLKMVPLPSWWQKLDLNEFPISELFEDLLSWNLESKLITPKYITGTYFGAIVAIFNSIFTVCFLGVMLFLTPERAPKAGPATCLLYFQNITWHKTSSGVGFYEQITNALIHQFTTAQMHQYSNAPMPQ